MGIIREIRGYLVYFQSYLVHSCTFNWEKNVEGKETTEMKELSLKQSGIRSNCMDI